MPVTALIGNLSFFCDVADMRNFLPSLSRAKTSRLVPRDEFVGDGLDVMARANKEGTVVNCEKDVERCGIVRHLTGQSVLLMISVTITTLGMATEFVQCHWRRIYATT